jgi:hypothetical protein
MIGDFNREAFLTILRNSVCPVCVHYIFHFFIQGQRLGNRALLGPILFSLQFLPNFKKVQKVSWFKI